MSTHVCAVNPDFCQETAALSKTWGMLSSPFEGLGTAVLSFLVSKQILRTISCQPLRTHARSSGPDAEEHLKGMGLFLVNEIWNVAEIGCQGVSPLLATRQRMWKAFKSWEWPPAVIQQENGTSVLHLQGTEFGQWPKKVWSRYPVCGILLWLP